MADLRILKVSGDTEDAGLGDWRIIKVSGSAAPVPVDLRILKVSGSITGDTVMHAGIDQTVDAFATVTLSAAASVSASTYAWSQTGGTSAGTITNASTVTATVTAPGVLNGDTLTFRVTGDGGAYDECTVTVRPHNAWTKTASGWVASRRTF